MTINEGVILSLFRKRRMLEEDDDCVWKESDRDFMENNRELVMAFLETLEAMTKKDEE